MSSPSNLYAEKIFSEHPSALWALDDTADYISLISENDRDLSTWSLSGGAALQTSVINEPFPNSFTTRLIGNITNDPIGTIQCISHNNLNENSSGINFLSLNKDLATFAISAYVYADNQYLSSVDIGYEYNDIASGQVIQKLKNFNTSVAQKWIFVSETFDVPSEDANLRLVLKINYFSGSQSQNDYNFLINGLSLGQWSEEFNSTSLGATAISLPSTISLNSSICLEAKSYGLQESSGYYLVKDNALVAKNSGMPMVYGASNVTILSPNGSMPSLIVPGYGFLNNDGKYKEYTFEAWLKINSDTTQEKRILGPISSSDGLYVHGPLMILKVGNKFGTYYVGEWSRPMLVHIRYSGSSANLLINGEQVISITLEAQDIDFPKKIDQYGKDQDWIGFYAYEDAGPLEIDCVATYPYQISQNIAKRRWVYGQGVEFPENINTAYSGTSVFVDYPFADYSNNYNYPDIGKWNQGIVENLSTDNNILSTPKYQLPSFVFDNKKESEWMVAVAQAQNEISNNFLTMYPDNSWSNTNGYILFDKMAQLSEDVKGFYGVFKEKENLSRDQILFHIEDSLTSNYFQIKISIDTIDYIIKYGDTEEILYSVQKYYPGEEFSVGIDIKSFSDNFGGNVAAFFGKKSSLSISVAGNKNFDKTFAGNIYRVGFCTRRNFSKISHFFNSKGIVIDETDFLGIEGGIPITSEWIAIYDAQDPDTIDWSKIMDGGTPASISTVHLLSHIASYTLFPKNYFNGIFTIDIAADSYWEDYIPLSYFAKYVKDATGSSYYDLDFIQFNINYPSPSKYVEQEVVGSWTYDELQQQYANPIQRNYDSLDNALFTNYENYTDLKNKSNKTYKYDTSNSLVKSYITFQYLKDGANKTQSNFSTVISASKNGIVNPGTYSEDWQTTKYEVVDNMIIYPPRGIDFNSLAIVMHVDFVVDGIITNPINIRKIQLASQSFSETSSNAIGTRFGTKIYPYKKSGVYYDFKGKNPFSIYKGSSPYLYLTRHSGIQLRGDYDPLSGRGLSIPINDTASQNYKVIASQMAIRYDEDFFPYSPTEIFEIQSKNSYIKFYLVANHPNGKRAKIYAVNAKTGKLENGIAFYWNGKIVKEPNITIKEWGMLGISFSSSLNFSNYSGALRITGPILFNNLSHYQSTNLQEIQQVTNRPWFKVKASGILEFDWQYWDTSYLWNGVLILASTSYYGVDPSDVYKSYTGTNKIVVDDTRPFRLKDYQYDILNNISWQTQTLSAL